MFFLLGNFKTLSQLKSANKTSCLIPNSFKIERFITPKSANFIFPKLNVIPSEKTSFLVGVVFKF